MSGAREADCWIAVNKLLQAYADAIDRADLLALVALFAEDAVWQHGPTTALRGRQEILSHLEHVRPRYVRTSHHVGPPSIAATTDAEAGIRSVAYFVAVHQLTDGARYTVYGRYVDDILVQDGSAVFGRHHIIAHVTDGADEARYEFLDRFQTQ
jgi:uncharacterized protein (TIGR02246 family)